MTNSKELRDRALSLKDEANRLLAKAAVIDSGIEIGDVFQRNGIETITGEPNDLIKETFKVESIEGSINEIYGIRCAGELTRFGEEIPVIHLIEANGWKKIYGR